MAVFAEESGVSEVAGQGIRTAPVFYEGIHSIGHLGWIEYNQNLPL